MAITAHATCRDGGVDRLIAALAGDEGVAALVLARLWDEVPTYESVAEAQVLASIERIVARCCRTLSDRVVPSSEQYWEAERTVLERLRLGVPIEDVLAGFRITIASVHRRLTELAPENGVDDAILLELTSLLWRLGDAFSLRGAAAYHQRGLAVAVADQRRRDEWITRALAGELRPDQIAHGVTVHRLRRDRDYRAFVTAPVSEQNLERVQQALSTEAGYDVLMVPAGGRLIGILERPPRSVPGLLLAVGDSQPVEALAVSYATAERVLEAARRQFAEGVHTAESLGWRLAAADLGAIGDLLVDRYLEPLARSGGFGRQVVDALRAYLACDRSIPRTAEALHVHVNTLRYRLARFEELTGRTLNDTDTIVELALVLYASPTPTRVEAVRRRR